CPCRSDLTLDVKVPVKDVGTLGILLDKTISDPLRCEPHVVVNTIAQRYSQAGISGAVPFCGSGRCTRLILPDDLEWRRCCGIKAKLVRKRQHVEDPETH